MGVTAKAKKVLSRLKDLCKDDAQREYRRQCAVLLRELADVLDADPEEAIEKLKEWEDVISTLEVAEKIAEIRDAIKKGITVGKVLRDVAKYVIPVLLQRVL